jgi:Putative Ig domain
VSDITASSFNDNIRNKMVEVIEQGYGDSLSSENIVRDVVTNDFPVIDDTQWDNLRLDIVKARVHQIGTQPTLTELPDVDEQDVITTVILDKYIGIADRAVLDIGIVANGQFEDVIPPTLFNPDLLVEFSGNAFHRTTINFSTPLAANQFFNSGGGFLLSINLTSQLSGPAGAQSRDFAAIGSLMGTHFFGRTQWRASTSNFVDFAPSQTSTDPIYSGNRVRFRSATNSSSFALSNQLILEVQLASIYASGLPSGTGVGFGDQVRLLAGINILQRQSALSIVSPKPSSYSYAPSWSFTAAPIVPPPPPPPLVPTVLIAGRALVVNQTATPFIPVVFSGGVAPITYAISPGLPPGLVFDTGTASISGTPTQTTLASTTYRITAVDNIGQTVWGVTSLGVGT